MSVPNTIQLSVISIGDGAPTEAFTDICGINATGFNQTAQTNDRYIRDCATPTAVPLRQVKVTGKSWTLTGNGYYNTDQQSIISAAVAVRHNYKMRVYDDDVAATLLGTWAGAGVLTSADMGTSENDLGTIQLTIVSHGAWAYTAAS